MNILLSDDHPMVRTGIKLLLSRFYPEAEFFEAGDYRQTREFLDVTTFHLLIVDRKMPFEDDGNNLQVLCQSAGDAPVIVLSASEDPTHIHDAIACGARGYLPKNTNDAVLLSAIQLVLSGGTYLPMASMGQIGEHGAGLNDGQHKKTKEETQLLTPRQQDILGRLAAGKTNKEIAREFNISPATVRTHVNAIFRQLSVTNRTEAVHVAGKLNLIPQSGE